jgi:hypothetical protein
VRQAFGKFCRPTGSGTGYRGSYPKDQTQNSDDEQYRAEHSRNMQSNEQPHRWLKQQRKHEGEDKRPDDIGRGVKSSQELKKEYYPEENDFSIYGERHRLFPDLDLFALRLVR